MTNQEARNKSRYGGYKHIAWETRGGEPMAERLSPQSLKRAMLDTGTQGKFICYDRGTSMIVWWSLAAMWLRLMKRNMFDFRDI